MSLNPFEDLESRMMADMNAAIGEGFTLLPKVVPPNQRAIADASRDEFDFCGLWNEKHARTDADKDPTINKRSKMRFTNFSASMIFVQAQKCDMTHEPKQGDYLVRTANGTTYEITDIRPDGYGSLSFALLEIGGPYEVSA